MFRGGDFGTFLLESRIVASGKEKYMVNWVRKFSGFQVHEPMKLSWIDKVPLFLDELKASGNYQDWQIRQADHAVRLYFVNFLAAFPDLDYQDLEHVETQVPSSEEAALHDFKVALRLRNYARQTEKTYVGWVRQYQSDGICIEGHQKISSFYNRGYGKKRRRSSPSHSW